MTHSTSMTRNTRETLLLIPGMLCDGRLFSPQVEALKTHVDVVLADPSDLIEDSIDAMARRLLDRHATKPVNVAGLSMGGIIAMAMVRLAPERIARLALLDTNHRADPPERRALRERQIGEVRQGRLCNVLADELKPNYLAARHRSDTRLLQLLMDMGLSLGDAAFIAQSRALLTRCDATDSLRAFTGPALVLCGEEDSLCPVTRHRELLGLLARGELVVLPETGHISTLESPEAVNSALLHWLASDTGAMQPG